MRSFFIVVFLFLSSMSFAQEPCYWQITDEDGLPSMTIYKILQDSKGFMWIGTAGGLCRYDGKEFEYYRHGEQLDDEIIHLKVDSLDRVWYSNLTGQLFVIESEKIRLLSNEEFGSKYSINHLSFTKSEVILSVADKAINNRNVNYYSNIGNEVNPLDKWKKIKLENAILIPHNKKNKN